MIRQHEISSEVLTLSTIENIIRNDTKLVLSDSAIEKIKHCRAFLDDIVENALQCLRFE